MLTVEGITKTFGGLRVLVDVGFAVEAGEIVGLLGPNGSGKSTLINILSGFMTASSGRCLFGATEIIGRPAHEISRLGLRRTFQLPRMPARMSCAELLLSSIDQPVGAGVLAPFTRRRAVRAEERAAKRRVFAMLERLELRGVADLPAAGVSGGQQKLLALGAALLGNARLLLLDEPTAGVNPTLRMKLVDALHEARRQGVTFLVVEHDMGFIGRLCDRCVVIDRGTVIASCRPQDLARNARVVEAYLGRKNQILPEDA